MNRHRGMIMALLVAGMLVSCGPKSPNTTDLDYVLTGEELNKLMAHVLSHWSRNFRYGTFTVVNPVTTNLPLESRKKVQEKLLAITGSHSDSLVNAFYEVNRASTRLTLRSDANKGYVIDYDGEYGTHLGEVGWDKFYEKYPKASGFTRVSLPVYKVGDSGKSIVLIYVYTIHNEMAAYGYVLLFRYRNGVLHKFGDVNLRYT